MNKNRKEEVLAIAHRAFAWCLANEPWIDNFRHGLREAGLDKSAFACRGIGFAKSDAIGGYGAHLDQIRDIKAHGWPSSEVTIQDLRNAWLVRFFDTDGLHGYYPFFRDCLTLPIYRIDDGVIIGFIGIPMNNDASFRGGYLNTPLSAEDRAGSNFEDTADWVLRLIEKGKTEDE